MAQERYVNCGAQLLQTTTDATQGTFDKQIIVVMLIAVITVQNSKARK